MHPKVKKHLARVLHHLYINPLEKCNLRCKICYTKKTSPVLDESQILSFIDSYQKHTRLDTVTFCGGEVFTLPYFPHLVNFLNSQSIFIQIITNGTIDKLDQFENPNSINLIVSIDGDKNDHDGNRGEGNFDKSISFLQKAYILGFHSEIFSVITQKNFNKIDAFETLLETLLKRKIKVTYHPRKPPSYLLHHPASNIFGQLNSFGFLDQDQMIEIIQKRNVFPPKGLGCYQIALVSNGDVYGCCEGTVPLGNISDDIQTLIDRLYQRLEIWEKTNTLKNCLGCSQPEFMCGIKKYLLYIDSI